MKLLSAVVYFLLLGACKGAFNDGTGVDTTFVAGTVGVPKLTYSMHASTDTAATALARNPVTVEITVEESDTTLTYQDGVLSGQMVHYETCHFLKKTDYDGNNRNRVACDLQRIDTTTPTGTDVESRTFYISIGSIDASGDDPDIACGGSVESDVIYFVVECNRQEKFARVYDAIVELSVDLTNLVVKTHETDVTVGPIPKIDYVVSFTVSMNGYVSTDAGYSSNIPTGTSATHPDISTVGVSLEEIIYLELTVSKNLADSQPLYFQEGEVVGAFLKSCYFVYSYTAVTGADASPVMFIGDDGCSTGSPMFDRGPADEDFMFFFAEADTLQQRKRTGNTGRTDFFQIIIPSPQNPYPHYGLIQCGIGYCTTFTDPRCFNKRGGSIAPPSCSRRKREAEAKAENMTAEMYNLPKELSVSFAINRPADKLDTGVDAERKSEGCPEKKNFYVLTSVFGLLLLVVVAIAAGMLVKVNSFTLGEGSSVKGVVNRAFN